MPQAPVAVSLESLNSISPEKVSLENVERVAYRSQPENHVLGASDKDRLGVERFKLLRYRLYRLRQQRTVKSVLITSAIPKEGKTTVAANLAVTLAQASERVLLADADLRKPSLHSLFGLTPAEGLAGHLQGRVELLGSLRRVDPLGFFFLGAGRSPANPVELLQGEAMRNAVKNTATVFDWVVIDSPPILPLADGRFLASLCDAVIVVVREEYTRQEDLRELMAALKGTNLAGIVLNGSNSVKKRSYAYYSSTAPTGNISPLTGCLTKQPARGRA
jgi:capsular exopolysaccharide synthesis family protein